MNKDYCLLYVIPLFVQPTIGIAKIFNISKYKFDSDLSALLPSLVAQMFMDDDVIEIPN